LPKLSRASSALGGAVTGAGVGLMASQIPGAAKALTSLAPFMSSNPVGWMVGIGAALGAAFGLLS